MNHRSRLPRRAPLAVAVLAALHAYGSDAVAQAARQLAPVTVIGTTPLPGIDTPLEQVPANVVVIGSEDVRRTKPLTLADQLNRTSGSVFINEAQGNPFQPDVTFRGFAASPLLGNAIGMSVFVDGVRVNEPFGDIVLWDLIPTAAIASTAVIPGANPVFGLNTLGGAMSVQTKSGRHFPGIEAEATTGSFGRRSGQVAGGYHSGPLDVFIAGQYHDENGWRDRSPSTVRQLFMKTGYASRNTEIDLSYTGVSNKLIGNGLVPESILAGRREAIYTYPDETRPVLNFLNVTLRHAFSPALVLSANLYHRRLGIATFNGDAEFNDGATPADLTDDEYEAENRRTATKQRATGGTLQMAFSSSLGTMKNRLTVGVSRDRGDARFEQLEQEADFTSDRGTIPDGDFELDTKVRGLNTYEGVYASNILSLTDALHLTLSGRYNRAKVEVRDETGLEPELNGTHKFSRFTPAFGATFALNPALTVFGGYSEGYRVPTPVELTCADPAAPCSLPVAFVADPPLQAVVAKSFEGGARGRAGGIGWNATVFRTDLRNDILFTSTGAGQGFFANVPKTRRQGVEVGVGGRATVLDWSVSYAYVDATFRSNVDLFNPLALDADPSQPATIGVRAGDRVPGIPKHRLKVGGDARIGNASVGASALYASSQYLRGDENNQQPQLPAYTVVNLRADYRFSDQWRVFGRVDNVFDRKYTTLGAYNRNAFDADSQPLEGVGPGPVERFVAPGAPRAFWVGVEFRFGGD